MRRIFLFVLCLAGFSATRPQDIPFEKVVLDLGANETCTFADLNGDGRLDIVSGENWYEAPSWKKHPFRQINFENNYIDNFSDLALDADGDGWTDIVSCSWFSKQLTFWKNPGKTGGEWKPAVIESTSPIEFCFLVDIDNDGKAREVLPQFGDGKAPLSWYEFRDGRWIRNQVAQTSFGHGIGAGDVNGDKRTDILTPQGWFEAPENPREGTWIWHSDWKLGSTGFLHVHDVNADGRPDVVGSMAHDYGIFWLEHTAAGAWEKRLVDDSWSQGHALTLIDVNQDGKLDLLTGKRYMAHNGKDPGEKEPLGIYWYEAQRDASGRPTWVRHIIDYSTRTGAGMQLPMADLDGDGDLDFAAGGKSGTFLFINRTK
jgi:hypothetical protein